ncbi:MAG: glycosyltransferase family 1 protein [Selenomonas ruminantium]|nr:glycosyltransferase family 1 protein [Selenomonas ruminantium]
MKRVLCLIANMDTGGAETLLMKLYRTMNVEEYQFDFLTYAGKNGYYDKEIINRGGKIYPITPVKKNPIKCFYDVYTVVKGGGYKSVLLSVPFSVYSIMLLIARMAGAKKIGLRCTNTKVGDGKISYTVLHYIFKPFAKVVTNVKLSPSVLAAEWMFGKGCVYKKQAVILNNGVQLDKFIFSIQRRKMIREEFNVSNKHVYGHVGRFVKQKNHIFLLKIFQEICKQDSEAVLLLVGTGMLLEDIKKKVYELKIENSVIFAGVRKDIPDIMMAMDVVIFPSYYEGMPNVIIEAQCTGLPCIIADTITRDVQVTDLIEFLSLEDDALIWANTAMKKMTLSKDIKRNIYNSIMKEKGYDINDVTCKFLELMT